MMVPHEAGLAPGLLPGVVVLPGGRLQDPQATRQRLLRPELESQPGRQNHRLAVVGHRIGGRPVDERKGEDDSPVG